MPYTWVKKRTYTYAAAKRRFRLPKRTYRSLRKPVRRTFKKCVRRGKSPALCAFKAGKSTKFTPTFVTTPEGLIPRATVNSIVVEITTQRGTRWYEKFVKPKGVVQGIPEPILADLIKGTTLQKKLAKYTNKYPLSVQTLYIYNPTAKQTQILRTTGA